MADETLFALAAELGRQCQAHGVRVATAESCTGGLVAGAITDVPGSSAWLDCGFVTYSDWAKQKLLGVAAATIKQHGAVSEETAREMAKGALQESSAQLVVAVTGIAGPGGGSKDKPVGTVCFAWALGAQSVRSSTHRFAGDRKSVRKQASFLAIRGLLSLLKDREEMQPPDPSTDL